MRKNRNLSIEHLGQREMFAANVVDIDVSPPGALSTAEIVIVGTVRAAGTTTNLADSVTRSEFSKLNDGTQISESGFFKAKPPQIPNQ